MASPTLGTTILVCKRTLPVHVFNSRSIETTVIPADIETFSIKEDLRAQSFMWSKAMKCWNKVELITEPSLEELIKGSVICIGAHGAVMDGLRVTWDFKDILKERKFRYDATGRFWRGHVSTYILGLAKEANKRHSTEQCRVAMSKQELEAKKAKRRACKQQEMEMSIDQMVAAAGRHVDSMRRAMIMHGIIYDGGSRILRGSQARYQNQPLGFDEGQYPPSMYNGWD